MSRQHLQKICAILLASLLLSAPFSPALAGAEDRYAQVFDSSQDAGKLTARFLKMTSQSGDKTGDATILTSPDGKIMLIDAGLPESVDQVIQALKDMGVEKIDYLVASHSHIDHIGGFARIIAAFEIGALYTSAVDYSTSHVTNYMEQINSRGIEHIVLSTGDIFHFGEHVQAEVFNPPLEISYYDGYPDNSTQFINDLSLLIRLSYQESSFLFGGDLYVSSERALAEEYGSRLQSDVFKVGHHGAATSSSRPYRLAIDPKIAVMINNAIADIGVYQRYSKNEIDTYHTFLDGTVKVSTPGDGSYEVLTQQDRASDFL